MSARVIPVAVVLDMLSFHGSEAKACEALPGLTQQRIQDALNEAARIVRRSATIEGTLRALLARDIYAGNEDGEHCPYCGGYRYAAEDAARYGTAPEPHTAECAYVAAKALVESARG